jgi:MOSC domain-containing protein YiiM
MIQLISVNIGRRQAIQYAHKSGETGIYKQPQPNAVRVTPLGLLDDAIVDVKNHGGPDQAVYLYTGPDYAWWSQSLGRELAPGTFGDNLTLSELESAACSVGDRLSFGEVVLEVTSPRIPCSTLAARMGDTGFVKRFKAAERPGLYCRVIQAGAVRAGEVVRYEPTAGPTVSILEMFRNFYISDLDEAAIRRQLAAPIAIRARADMENLLARKLAA